MTDPTPADTLYAAETVDAEQVYAELSRQFGLALGQVIQLRMLVDQRGARIIELEAAIRDGATPPAA